MTFAGKIFRFLNYTYRFECRIRSTLVRF